MTTPHELWTRGDTRIAVVASVASGLLWATCLAFPGDTLSRPTYKLMATVGPEWCWLTAFLLLATLQFWRLYCKLTHMTAALELIIKVMAAALWTFVAVACMLAQYPPAAAVSDTIVVAALTWWDLLRWDHNGYYRLEDKGQCDGRRGI